jgi:ATP-dependent Clp protease adaptor protein ClpS
MSNEPVEQGDVAVEQETRTRLQRPPLYRVLLHNDDYTTQQFVVYILQTIFMQPPETAYEIMMHVHTRGLGVAGIYPYEVAEAKVGKVHALARENEYPLQCSIEPE